MVQRGGGRSDETPPAGAPADVLVVTGNYPSAEQPTNGTFVRAFVHAMVDTGATAKVIHPVSVFARIGGPYPKGGWDISPAGNRIQVFRPVYASFSVRNLGVFNTAVLTQAGFERATLRVAQRLPSRPSAVYGHFLYQAGKAAIRLGERLDVPSFVAVGEGTFWTVEPVGFRRAAEDFRPVTGLVAVSNPIRRGLEEKLGVPSEKIAVFPNGADRRIFKPLDRSECRSRLGLPQARTLVAFVGTFNEAKGGPVLLEAARGMKDFGLLLLGSGTLRLESPETVFSGSVPHAQLPEWLGAADFFVLPSLVEGSCNAIVEAMSMGLPIVTSRADFMDDLVDDEIAIRVDPRDVHALRAALEVLQADPAMRARMSAAALRRAEVLDISVRAERVLAWMKAQAAREKRKACGGMAKCADEGAVGRPSTEG